MADEIINKNNLKMRVLDLDPTTEGLVQQLKCLKGKYITAKFHERVGIDYGSGWLRDIDETIMELNSHGRSQKYLHEYLTGVIVFD